MKHILSLFLVITLIASCQQVPGRKGPVEYQETHRAPNARGGIAESAAKPDSSVRDESAAVEVKKIVKVALLLPLTGRHSDLGRALQDAATVSLFDKYARLSPNQQAVKVELISKDTGDSPERARAAMTAALSEGAELIIGPVFADATEAAAPLAAAKNIPVLSFSNNRSRAAVVGTYLLGFSPQEQALRVVRYAVANNRQRIAVLVPRSPVGDEVLAAANAVVKETGKLIILEARYAPQGVGLDAALSKLIPAGGGAPSFDAVLLAETGAPLESILKALAARGVSPANTQFMGTGMWDDAGLLARTNLDGAWLASSAPNATSDFEIRFKNTYGYAPPRISSLAYDAVALAVTLAVSNRPYSAENLTTNGGFLGPANGIFRLRNGGAVERGLAVLQVENGKLKVISPAPTGF